MRRPSSIEPFTPSATVALHPALQAALDNLDVQIEEELTRFRRQRRYPELRSKPTLAAPGSKGAAIGILRNNIQMPALGSSIYASEAVAQTPVTPPASRGWREAGQTEAAPLDKSLSNNSPQQQEFSRTSDQRTASVAAVAPPQLATEHLPQQPLPEQPSSKQPSLKQPNQLPNLPPELLEVIEAARISSYAEQNDLSAYTPNSALQRLVHQPFATPDSAPADYLASSEELLRSIAGEEPELRAAKDPNSMLDTLLTPLGVGSMLLLLLSSTSLGYVIMHPSSLGLWQNAQPNQQSNPAATATADAPAANSSSAAPSPDLASDEFVDLTLDTLSTLPIQPWTPGVTPATKAKAAATGTPTQPAARLKTTASSASAPPVSIPPVPAPLPSLSTVVVPAVPVAPPREATPQAATAPAPSVAAPASVSPEPISVAPPITSEPITAAPTVTEPAVTGTIVTEPTVATAPAASGPQNRYYVVTDYNGDASLQTARGAIPDAYVRNLPSAGAKVQLGAFSDEVRAQELQQQLQQQGIQAEVYPQQ